MSEELFNVVKDEDGVSIWWRDKHSWQYRKEPAIRVVGTIGELYGKRSLTPIKGSKVNVVDDGFLFDVKKGYGHLSEDEKRILQRIQKLEQLSYEQRALEKIRQGGILSIGQPSIKVKPVQQPSVKREEVKLEEIANRVVKGILRGEFTQRGYDGTPYLMKNVELMLAKKAKQLGVN